MHSYLVLKFRHHLNLHNYTFRFMSIYLMNEVFSLISWYFCISSLFFMKNPLANESECSKSWCGSATPTFKLVWPWPYPPYRVLRPCRRQSSTIRARSSSGRGQKQILLCCLTWPPVCKIAPAHVPVFVENTLSINKSSLRLF